MLQEQHAQVITDSSISTRKTGGGHSSSRLRIVVLGSFVLVLAVLIAGTAFILNRQGGLVTPAQAYVSPQVQLRDAASHAGFPMLVPSWLPQGMELTSASGDGGAQGYTVTLQYALHPPVSTPKLVYDVYESGYPTFSVGYQFVDENNVAHDVPSTTRQVTFGSHAATLREYSFVWQGQIVTHALSVEWVQGTTKYVIAVQDVFTLASAANAPRKVQVETLPPASVSELLHIAQSFQPYHA